LEFASTLQEFFMGIGVDWVLYLLVALSVLSIAVIIERLVFYARRRVSPEHVQALCRGEATGRAADAIETRIAAHVAALAGKGLPKEEVADATEQELRKLKTRYESGLTFLATLGNNAPFVGLLGTVLGIMAAFYELSAIEDTTQKNEALMTAISEALIATAMGLIVAIPAVAFYNVFRKRVTTAVEQAREVVSCRMRMLFEEDHGSHGTG